MNLKPNQHEMELLRHLEDGSTEYVCPMCRRHIRVYWSPVPKKDVIEPGDTSVDHALELDMGNEPDPNRLTPFEDWINQYL